MRNFLYLTALSLSLSSCAFKTYKDDKAILYRMEGYYNLGQFDQSIAEAKKIQPDSRHYKKAQEWITLAEVTKKAKATGGSHPYYNSYDYTRTDCRFSIP